MKKSKRLVLTGNLQSLFFEQFIKENAVKLGVRGYLRKLDSGKLEIFIEGNVDEVDEMVSICKRGTQHTQIRNVDEKTEKFQDFKDFKVLKI